MKKAQIKYGFYWGAHVYIYGIHLALSRWRYFEL
jgi:hypothetical protein